jgi:hypothetical protein
MKVTIEIDLPKGVSKAEAEGALKQYFDPDWMSSWWHISDVHTIANQSGEDEADEITDEEAREVLKLMEKNHDSNIGINWETIDLWVDIVKKQRKEIA